MRLTKDRAAAATEELLAILAQHPEGLSTRDLVELLVAGSMDNAQVIRVLRASGQCDGRLVGQGNRWAMRWRLKVRVAAVEGDAS